MTPGLDVLDESTPGQREFIFAYGSRWVIRWSHGTGFHRCRLHRARYGPRQGLGQLGGRLVPVCWVLGQTTVDDGVYAGRTLDAGLAHARRRHIDMLAEQC